jgi:hypothetical protein
MGLKAKTGVVYEKTTKTKNPESNNFLINILKAFLEGAFNSLSLSLSICG